MTGKSIIVEVDTVQGPKKIEMQDTSSADAHSDIYYYYKVGQHWLKISFFFVSIIVPN